MVSMIQMAGVIAFAAMLLAIAVLARLSMVKSGRGKPGDNEDGDGLDIMYGGSTPGDWDGGSPEGP